MTTPLRALIVEDSEDDAILVKRELRRAGYELKSVRVDSALAMREAMDSQQWEIVISDFSMPGFGGLDALEIAKDKDPDMPFIIVSGAIGEDTATAAMRAGAHDYIMKDNLTRLAPAIDRELREAEARREHRRAEQERERMEEQLRQAQKMEALGELAGGIAHDFNNLLMAIGGSVCLLESCIPSLSSGAEELATIHRAVRRGAELTQRLLAVGRQQVLQMIDLDLNQLVRRELTILRRVIPKSISIELKAESDLPAIHADPVQLAQVLMNFCVNARDAMPSAGTITIETRRVLVEADYLAQGAQGRKGGKGGRGREGAEGGRQLRVVPHVLLSLADTGAGMDPETAAHIFEPFFSTKEIGKGSGLGLATVYGIVKQHGGMIDVESEVGKGTKFTILLPAVDRPPQPIDDRSELPIVGGDETILVVDDDPDVRRALLGMLSSLGYTVLEAGDGVQGLHLLSQQGNDVNLVLSDVIMPRMGGQELFAASRELELDTPFLFSSGHTEENLRSQLDAEDGAFFIAKPYTLDQLARTLREILSNGTSAAGAPVPDPGGAR